MDKKSLLVKMAKTADELEAKGLFKESKVITDTMVKLSQNMFTQYNPLSSFQTPNPAPAAPAAPTAPANSDAVGVLFDKIGTVGTFLDAMINYVNQNKASLNASSMGLSDSIIHSLQTSKANIVGAKNALYQLNPSGKIVSDLTNPRP